MQFFKYPFSKQRFLSNAFGFSNAFDPFSLLRLEMNVHDCFWLTFKNGLCDFF